MGLPQITTDNYARSTLGHIAAFEFITPADATSILEKGNDKNRPVVQARINAYTEAMSTAGWVINGDTIVFSADEKLLNGQHRLLAIIESEQPQECLVVRGVDEAAFATIDIGRPRSASDVLAIMGVENGRRAGAILRLTLAYMRGINVTGTIWSPPMIQAAYEKHPEVGQFVADNKEAIKVGRVPLAAVGFVASTFGPDETKAAMASFLEGIASGANLGVDDPRLRYRNFMMGIAGGSRPGNSRAQQHGSVVQQWNRALMCFDAHLKNKPMKLLKAPDPKVLQVVPTVTRIDLNAAW